MTIMELIRACLLGAFVYRDVGKGREQERKLCVFARERFFSVISVAKTWIFILVALREICFLAETH